jgi:hypothetical protein
MSNENKITGKIINIFDAEEGQSKAGKAWKKQGFLIDTGASYNPEVYLSSFGQDKCDKLNEHNIGDHIDVYFNVQCREFNGKFYTNLDAWKFDKNNVSANGMGEDTPKAEAEEDVPF